MRTRPWPATRVFLALCGILSLSHGAAIAQGACDLLTKEVAEAVLGEAVGDPVGVADNYCGYSGESFATVSVNIESGALEAETSEALAAALNDILRKSDMAGTLEEWQPVDFPGFAAASQDVGGAVAIRIRRGNGGLMVTAPTHEQAVDLAHALADTL